MTSALDIFSKLLGSWTIARTVSNYRIALNSSHMNGTAVFSQTNEKNLLHYQEEGILTIQKAIATEQLSFKREYLYEYSKEGKIVIYFNENPKRLFQILEIKENNKFTGDHLCIKDNYHGTYDFNEIEQNSFKITYVIKGPNKDQEITTYFQKILEQKE